MSVMFVKGSDDNDSHVEHSHRAATALCSAEREATGLRLRAAGSADMTGRGGRVA